MKNIFHVDFIKQLHQDSCHWTKNKRAQIAGSTNNLMWHLKKNESLCARKERLVHDAGHVSWKKDETCEK